MNYGSSFVIISLLNRLGGSGERELAEKGLEDVTELLRVLINNVMQAERSKYLQAGEIERTENRKGHANGYKPNTVRTLVGEITFAIPQVREGGFYRSALEKGLRSERSLVTTLAEMYACTVPQALVY